MEAKNSNSRTRTGIVLVSVILLSMVLVVEYNTVFGWTNIFKLIALTLFILFITGIYFVYGKSGLWHFTHKSLKELDEREIILIHKSLRQSYAIFSITVLLIFLYLALSGHRLTIVTASSLILFAHLIPASIIGWTQTQY